MIESHNHTRRPRGPHAGPLRSQVLLHPHLLGWLADFLFHRDTPGRLPLLFSLSLLVSLVAGGAGWRRSVLLTPHPLRSPTKAPPCSTWGLVTLLSSFLPTRECSQGLASGLTVSAGNQPRWRRSTSPSSIPSRPLETSLRGCGGGRRWKTDARLLSGSSKPVGLSSACFFLQGLLHHLQDASGLSQTHFPSADFPEMTKPGSPLHQYG